MKIKKSTYKYLITAGLIAASGTAIFLSRNSASKSSTNACLTLGSTISSAITSHITAIASQLGPMLTSIITSPSLSEYIARLLVENVNLILNQPLHTNVSVQLAPIILPRPFQPVTIQPLEADVSINLRDALNQTSLFNNINSHMSESFNSLKSNLNNSVNGRIQEYVNTNVNTPISLYINELTQQVCGLIDSGQWLLASVCFSILVLYAFHIYNRLDASEVKQYMLTPVAEPRIEEIHEEEKLVKNVHDQNRSATHDHEKISVEMTEIVRTRN